MHNIAQNYTQVKNTYKNKILSTYSLIKKKIYNKYTYSIFFWRRGVFCIIKRRTIKSQPDKNNKKKMQSTFMFKTDNKYKHSCLNHKDGPVF